MLLRQLNFLVTLAQEQHFGRAAEKCHVSQPAFSEAIRTLELDLGICVVQRSRRFEGFTAEGEKVLLWARRIVADCAVLRREACNPEQEPSGMLRLGAIPTVLSIVPLMTDSCLAAYPRVAHQIYTLATSDILKGINHFELDIGMTYLGDERLKAYQTYSLFNERYVLIARDDAGLNDTSGVTWHDVSELPLCLLTRNMQCRLGIDEAFAEAGVQVTPRVETDSMMVLYGHVRCSGLYSVVPHSALALAEMRDEIVAIPIIPQLQREIGLVLLRHDPRSLLLESAVELFTSLDLQRRVDGFLRC